MPKFVEVLVNKSRTYTYSVPEGKDAGLQTGSAIAVPLRTQVTTGYILAFVPRPEFPTKDIIGLQHAEQAFDANLLLTARWMAAYYRCGLPAALKTILPKK